MWGPSAFGLRMTAKVGLISAALHYGDDGYGSGAVSVIAVGANPAATA
jgi:hypothetical protein